MHPKSILRVGRLYDRLLSTSGAGSTVRRCTLKPCYTLNPYYEHAGIIETLYRTGLIYFAKKKKKK